MKKILLLSALAIFTTITTKAQTTSQAPQKAVHFGVKGGLNMANMYNSFDGEKQDTKYRVAYYVGGFMDYIFTNELSGEIGIQFVDNGFSFKEDEGNTNYSIKQLNVPFIAKYKVIDGAMLKGGVYLGKILSAKYTYKEETGDIKHIANFDFGASVGAEYLFNNGLLLEANYNFGLANLAKEDKANVKNRDIQIGIGYRF